ncbi:MAG: hypothetical protein KKI02_01650, partial [Planctomycetes bacterium]|nr:hypothetical protein [Planctomycetota bacterium]
MRAERIRAFREHPFVCWAAIVMVASGGALLAAQAVISAVRGGRTVPLMEWGSVALMGLPLIWLGVMLRLGPLSPKRRSRAEFWKLGRLFLWVMAASTLFKLTLVSVALIYGSRDR